MHPAHEDVATRDMLPCPFLPPPTPERTTCVQHETDTLTRDAALTHDEAATAQHDTHDPSARHTTAAQLSTGTASAHNDRVTQSG